MSEIKIIQGDCLEVMKTFEDNQFDLVVTDPPYGIKQNSHRNKSRTKLAPTTDFGDFEWDNDIPPAEVFCEILRVSKNQIIFGGNYFVEHLKNSPCWFVWDKDNGSSRYADCELAWTSLKGAVRKFTWRWNGMIQENMGDMKEKRVHPTQKPRELMIWCLRKAFPCKTVLDPYLGSGSTAVACQALSKDCVGIEISPEYCEIARKRVQEEKDKMGLFP